MDIEKNIKIIDNLYSSATYNSRYGLDVLITIIIVVTLLLLTAYILIINNLKSLKANWENEKCNPINFPFVHMINRDPNKTPAQQIQDNINECIESSVKDLTENVTGDIYTNFDILNVLQMWFNNFSVLIQKIIIWLLNIIVFLINTLLSVLQKSYLGMVHIFIAGQDFFNRLLALVATKFFMFIVVLNITMGFVLNFATIAAITIMIPLGITIAALSLLILLVAKAGKIALALGFAKLSIPFPPGLGALLSIPFFTVAGFKKATLVSLIITLVSTVVLFIIMGTVILGLYQIQRSANKFIAPSLRTSG